MKRSELLFNLASVPLDIVMLILASVASFYTRLHTVGVVGPVQYNLQIDTFLTTVVKVLPIVLLIFAMLGLYNLRGTRKFSYELGRIILGISAGLFLVIVLFFFRQSLFPSRFIILAAWGYGILFVNVGRLLLRQVQEFRFGKGHGLHHLVIINGAGQESKVIEHMLVDPAHGYKIVKELTYSDTVLEKLDELYLEEKIDEIMQTSAELESSANLKLVEFAKNKGLHFSFVPNLFDVQRNITEVLDFHGVPVIGIKNTPLDGWGKVAKRIVDIIGSSIAMLLLSPVYLAVYIAVKLNSPGPAIYPALRGGRGKDFWFFKFRSMHAHLSPGLGGESAEQFRQRLWEQNDRGGKDVPFLKVKNDPRVTRVGRFIRKTKLDEIPQFWNVLKGDMSLVGPRAHVLDEVERYRNRYRRMFSIKPGIFGASQLAQLSWPDLPFEEEIRLNTYYIENWSIWLDLEMLVKSMHQIFFGEKGKGDY